MQRTVLKVPIAGKKCQTEIMKAVAKLDGIEKMEVDASKGTLTIVGEIEPVPIFKMLKKIGKTPEIVSVGPPRPKCEPWCNCTFCCPYVNQTHPTHSCPSYCKQCEVVTVSYPSSSFDGPGQCSIL